MPYVWRRGEGLGALGRWFIRAVIVFLLGLLLWVIAWGALLATHLRDAYRGGERLRETARENPSALPPDIARASAAAARAERDLLALRVVTWVPGIREDAESIRELLERARFLLAAADVGVDILGGFRSGGGSVSSYGDLRPDDLRRLEERVRALAPKIHALARRGEAFSARPPESHSARLNAAHARLDGAVRQTARAAALFADGGKEFFRLLGTDGDRRYLLLFEDADELRPGGGIISLYGLLTVRGGQVADLSIWHVERDLLKDPTKYPPAPEPIRRFVFPLLTLPDINWTAAPADWLADAYAQWNAADPRRVDGVVAVGTPVLEDLVGFTGPLRLPGFPGEYTASNVVAAIDFVTIEEFRRLNGTQASFDIARVLLDALLARLRATSPRDWQRLAPLMANRLAARDLHVFVPDREEQDWLRALGVRDLLPLPPGDELLVLDANLGSGKTDGELRRSLALDVDLRDAAGPRATATVTYDFRSARPDARKTPYEGYLRLLVPRGSVLGRFTGGQDVPETFTDAGRTVFANQVAVNFGNAREVRVAYALPDAIGKRLADGAYALALRKQGGLELPFTVTISLPHGWSRAAVRASAGALARTERQVVWHGVLTADSTIEIHPSTSYLPLPTPTPNFLSRGVKDGRGTIGVRR